ncbi:MAG: DUF4097 domain-containing protein [Oscillospiraceae bacterium]|nr:DUF4097 domain-containing protein [Oscillospiraceae bacterium]
MNAIRIVTIICWVVVGIVLLGLAGWFLTGTVLGARPAWLDRHTPFRIGIGGFEALAGPFNVVGEHSADPSGINSISVDWVAGEITIMPHAGSEIQITELAQRELDDDERFSINISGGTLDIRFVANNVRGLMRQMPQKRLEVLVPRSLSENLDSLNVDSVSGGVNVDGMSIARLDVGTTSGAIELSNLTSQSLDANSTSGRIVATSVRAEDMSLSSTSGAVAVTSSQAGEMDIGTLSGAIRVSGASAGEIDLDSTSGAVSASGAFDRVSLNSLSGAISLDNSAVRTVVNAESTSGTLSLSGEFYSVAANTLSGGISVRSAIVPASLNLRSTSGSLRLTVPNEGPVTVSHSSTSGRFNSELPVIMHGADAQFVFSTLSGNTSIFELE